MAAQKSSPRLQQGSRLRQELCANLAGLGECRRHLAGVAWVALGIQKINKSTGLFSVEKQQTQQTTWWFENGWLFWKELWEVFLDVLGSNRLFSGHSWVLQKVYINAYIFIMPTFCRQNARTLWTIESRQLCFHANLPAIAKILLVVKWRKVS